MNESIVLHSLHLQAVDKVGRTARRTVDTHIKNAISKPRVATTLRRMTAMFNFISDLRKHDSLFSYIPSDFYPSPLIPDRSPSRFNR